MADIKDVTTVIASALTEISLNGTVDVAMDGDEKVVTIGQSSGDDVKVVVQVERGSATEQDQRSAA